MPLSEITNRNFQSPLNFEFRVDRLTDFNFFIQKINIPGLTLSPATSGGTNPFAKIFHPGDHLEFGELSIDFKINEGLANWYEIFSWMQGLGYPETTNQYQALKSGVIKNLDGEPKSVPLPQRKQGELYGQGTLLVNSSQNNPIVKITFVDIHPVGLSEIVFDTREQDVLYATSTVNFRYDYFTVEKIL